MIYVTGDRHGDYRGLSKFCAEHNTTIDDILVILGDNGINYYNDARDAFLKNTLSSLPITLFCIRGNHDKRPEDIGDYSIVDYCGAKAYQQAEYPNLIFAIDGEVYTLADKKCAVIGGAYSVDKKIRLARGGDFHWFENEQLSSEEMSVIAKRLKGQAVDFVFTHTCPATLIPYDTFKGYISGVDRTTEDFLDLIELNLDYSKWYCGHYHINRATEKLHFLYGEIVELAL